MKILVFDTCFNKSYIVLREDNTILSSKIINSTEDNYHSAYVIPEIRNILKDNNIQIKDLEAIGINIGPGSFTGIRAGITIARVLAQQTNLKLIGIESLMILSKLNKTEKKSLIVTDARKNKVYTALYDKQNTLIKPKLEDKENIIKYIDNNTYIISDKTINKYLNELNIELLESLEGLQILTSLALIDVVEVDNREKILGKLKAMIESKKLYTPLKDIEKRVLNVFL